MGREAVEEGGEPTFGGDGVRGLTSTTLRLFADNDEYTVEDETLLDASAGTAEAADKEEERPCS